MYSERKGPSGRRTGRRIVRLVNGALDMVMLLVFLVFLAFGCYALWDTRQVEREAQSDVYTKYRPTEEDTRSFEDFQRLNPEVFGWLTVYGTNIDYPLVQGEDNDKYLNTAADSSYSLSGSLFLDYRNSRDMSDFNSIIYGHHMKDEVMFGELGYFKEKDYFDQHRYGQIFYGGKYYGLDFFAFLEVDAYNSDIYNPGVAEETEETYLELLRQNAVYWRDVAVAESDRIVLLSTCTSDITNGRHILAGILTDEVPEDLFQETDDDHERGISRLEQNTRMILALLTAALIVMVITLVILIRKRREK